MAVAGDAGLLEDRTLRRFREDNVALTSVSRIALERLRGLQDAWTNQPEGVRRSVSLPPSLTYAQTRLDILYRKFFSAPPEALGEFEIKDELPGGA